MVRAPEFPGPLPTPTVVLMTRGFVLFLLLAGCGDGAITSTSSDGGADATSPPDLTEGPDLAPWVHPPMPQLAAGSGKVLDHVNLVTITYPTTDNVLSAEAFGDYVFSSDWLHAVGDEYGIKGGKHLAKVELVEAAPKTISDGAIKAFLRAKIMDKTLPSPLDHDQMLYMIYFPLNTAINSGTEEVCSQFGGYHGEANYVEGNVSKQFCYAVIGECAGTTGEQTITASHELIEAMTDPFPYTAHGYGLDVGVDDPWELENGQEVGDMCEYEDSVADGGFEVTKSWSNKAAAMGLDPCVPADRKVYENVMVLPEGVPELEAGSTATFRIIGWAVGNAAPWKVTFEDGTNSAWTATAQQVSLSGSMIWNAGVLTLTLVVPSDGASGTLGGVLLRSGPSVHGWPISYTIK